MRITPLPFLIVLGSISASLAQPESPATNGPAVPSRDELRDQQLDATLEARDIERILTRLKRASDLSKERIAEAAKVAESASAAIERGDSKSAEVEARQAAEIFREIARQLEALLQEETPPRVAAARNLAEQLSALERQFAKEFPGALNSESSSGKGKVDPKSVKRTRGQGEESPPKAGERMTEKTETEAGKSAEKDDRGEGQPGAGGSGDKERKDGAGGEGENKEKRKESSGGGTADVGMTEDELRLALAAKAAKLAETARTLQDVLRSIAESTEPGDQEIARKVAEIIKETQLDQTFAGLKQAETRIRGGALQEVRLAALDAADRLEIAGQRLDAAYQAIVAPQAETLMQIERQLAELRDRQQELKTSAQVAAWHRDVSQLLQQLEELHPDSEKRELLLEAFQKAGWGTPTFQQEVRRWNLDGGHFVLPQNYDRLLAQVQDELQARIQSLVLSDLTSIADEATPPMYQDLVERYLKVLSQERGGPTSAR
jgi:hypothetical protein